MIALDLAHDSLSATKLLLISCLCKLIVVSICNLLGGTVVAALELIKERGVVDNKQLKVVSFKLIVYSVGLVYPLSHFNV